LPEPLPKISLIVDTGSDPEAVKLVAELMTKTSYNNLEIILVSDAQREIAVPDNVRVISSEWRGKAENLNFGASKASGDILCFVDSGLVPLDKNWLADLAGFAFQTEIGAVGGKLIDPRERVIQAGLVIGTARLADSAHEGFFRDDDGSLFRNVVTGNYAAVSASCMAIRRSVFASAGGFAADVLPNALFDADLCLRLGESGYRIVFTPYAELKTYSAKNTADSSSELSPAEIEYFSARWKNYLKCDRFYNPNLSGQNGRFSIDV
jgi:cellulose synthase/poly-beta-1,6-N-acetylglucosamine synthase-like glycosyltransferase